jgi:ABC-type xylose transport system substrate-binding protein
VEPGDVLFVSRGHVTWGEWSHATVVVVAPANARWVRPGSLAVLQASIQDGVYLDRLETYADWPRVRLKRASHDPEVRRRIAEAALTHRSRLFAGVVRGDAPYTNCTTSVISALKAVGLDPGVRGWRTPDELLRSAVWVN